MALFDSLSGTDESNVSKVGATFADECTNIAAKVCVIPRNHVTFTKRLFRNSTAEQLTWLYNVKNGRKYGRSKAFNRSKSSSGCFSSSVLPLEIKPRHLNWSVSSWNCAIHENCLISDARESHSKACTLRISDASQIVKHCLY